MEKTIKVQKRNTDNVLIVKPIPEDLVTFYMNAGWELVKENSKLDKQA